MLSSAKWTCILNNVRRASRTFSSTIPTAKTIPLATSGSHLTLPAESLSSHTVPLRWRWLRDSCPCPKCIHSSNRQKLHRTSDVSAKDPLPVKAEVTDGELLIDWQEWRPPSNESETESARADHAQGPRAGVHRSVYPFTWLQHYATPHDRASFHLDDTLSRIEWDKQTLLDKSPSLFVNYSELDEPEGLQTALTQLIRCGLVFIRGVPNEKKDDLNCELRRLASIFGRIRETFYGQVWDVRSIKESKNIAYTNLDLGLHMDLLYMTHPPRFQILHCLLNRVHGGTSYFVDAIHTASLLRLQNPSAFKTLVNTPVPYHYINDGHHLWRAHPVIQLSQFTPHTSAPADMSSPQIDHINYSPPFQAPLYLDTPEEFYSALKEYADLLAREEGEFRYTMEEGDAVIFDNRRVLHARTEFWDKEGMMSGEGGTRRWLKGCYLEADDVVDRVRVLIEKHRKK